MIHPPISIGGLTLPEQTTLERQTALIDLVAWLSRRLYRLHTCVPDRRWSRAEIARVTDDINTAGTLLSDLRSLPPQL